MFASPGELKKCIATSLGVSEKTVIPIDRELASSGLRRTGGRGPNAVKSNASDAAAVLVGVATPGTIRTTSARVKSYFSLPRTLTDIESKNAGLPMPTFSLLPVQHSFQEALTALLSDHIDNHVYDGFYGDDWFVSVTLSAPWRSAVIKFNGMHLGEAEFVYMNFDADCSEEDVGLYGDGKLGDLHAEFRFTSETLQAIGDTIAGRKVASK